MQFISDNYIWFMVVIVVAIMTIIGYIAEKTDFGHKKVEDSKPKKEKLKIEDIKDKNLTLQDAVYKDVIIKENNLENQIPDEVSSTTTDLNSEAEIESKEDKADNTSNVEKPVVENYDFISEEEEPISTEENIESAVEKAPVKIEDAKIEEETEASIFDENPEKGKNEVNTADVKMTVKDTEEPMEIVPEDDIWKF